MKYRIKITELNNGTITYEPQARYLKLRYIGYVFLVILFPFGIIYFFLQMLDNGLSVLNPFEWEYLSKYRYDTMFSAETIIKEHFRTRGTARDIAKIEERRRNLLKVKKTHFINYKLN